MEWIQANWDDLLIIYTAVVTIASVVVKLTPSLRDDNVLLPIVKFLGKFIALNTNAPDKRPE